MIKSYKEKFEFSKRRNETNRILKKYPDRIPIIVEVSSSNIKLEKTKYLCPGDITCGQFFFVVRKQTNLLPEQSLFLFINNTLPSNSVIIKHLYKDHKDDDGFLYIIISEESTFGSIV